MISAATQKAIEWLNAHTNLVTTIKVKGEIRGYVFRIFRTEKPDLMFLTQTIDTRDGSNDVKIRRICV